MTLTRNIEDRPEVTEVRRNILNKLLYVFLFFGLPAVVLGATQAYRQGKGIFSLIYAGMYLFFALATFFSRRSRYTLRALILVVFLFLVALAVLVRIGMSGVGLQLLMGVCFLASALFGLRGGVLTILISLVGIGFVAVGMTSGFIEIRPENMLTSRSAAAWATAISVFFMVVTATIIVSELFRRRIEESLDRLQEQQKGLQETTQRLTSVISGVPVILFGLNRNGIFTLSEGKGLERLGQKPGEVVGRSVFEVYQDYPRICAAIRQSLDGQLERATFDLGSLVYDVSCTCLRNEQGEPEGLLGVAADITDWKKTEQALRESEALFRSQFEFGNIGIAITSVEKGWLRTNARLCAILGYDAEELQQKTWAEMTYPEDLPPDVAQFERMLTGEIEAYEMDKRFFRRDGNVVDTHLAVSCFRNPDRSVRFVIASIQDISERKSMEAALRASEERARRQRAAIDGLVLDEAIAAGELPAALRRVTEVLSASAGVERASVWLLSENGSELRCLSLFEAGQNRHSEGAVLPAKDFPSYLAAIRAEGLVAADDARNDPHTREFTEVYLAPLGIASMLDAGIQIEGKLMGVVCLGHTGEKRNWHSDEKAFVSTAATIVAQVIAINERKRAEAALRSSEKKYRSVIENIQDVFYRSDEQGRLLMGSPSGAEMFGYASADEMIGLPLDQFWPDPRERQDLIDRISRDGSVRDFEAVLIRKDGTTFHASFTTHFYRDDRGRILGTEGIIRDITERRRSERELQFSHDRFRIVMDSLDAAVYVADMETYEILFINRFVLMQWGDVVGQTCWQVLQLNQTGPCPFCTNEKLMDGQGKIAGVYVWEAQNTSDQKWYECRDQAIRWTDGRMVRLEIATDITERKRTAERLSQEMRFSDTVIKSLPGIFFVFTPQGYLVRWNAYHEKVLGLSTEEMPTLQIQQLVDAGDRELVSQKMQEVFQQGYADLEANIVTKRGEKIPFHLTGVSMSVEGEVYLVGTGTDITDRQRAEEEMRRLRNYLANIIDSMPSVLVGVDGNGCVTQWNTAAERMTGLKAEVARGQRLDQVLPLLGRNLEKVRQAMRDRTVQAEIKVPRVLDGDLRYEDVTVYPLATNGVEGAVIRVDDVTERVRIEEMMVQSEKMLSVGGLAAGMAHEINNPLGVILQASQNVLRRVSPELAANARVAEECGTTLEAVRDYLEKREIPVFLEDIRQSGRRAAEIVSNMLRFSRKSEGGGSSADLRELLDRTVELAGSDYDLKKKQDFRQIEMVREYQPDVPPVVCQPNQIQQVFLNILRNGTEAMREPRAKSQEQGVKKATPRFILRVMREGEMVRVEIEDNGPGMDEATRKRVFEPFFTTKPPGVGTGLGMSVSYFIITEEHRGRIAVESIPGAGSRFIIQLPVEERVP
jgi:PAS domain S-box-containing protein